MSLLLLLGDGISPDPDSGDAAAQVLLETTPGQWADISSRCRSGSINRGRQRELDQYQAARCTAVVTNSDRHFDPNYADGPYAGNLKPMRGLQVRASYAGITYPQFTGYLDRIQQRYLGPHSSEADLIATDGFKILARKRLPPSVYIVEVSADQPARWYRLDEPSDTPIVFDSIARADGTPIGDPAFGSAGIVDRDPGSAMATTASPVQGFSTDVGLHPAAISGTGPFSIEFWLQCGVQAGSGGGSVFYQPQAPGTAAGLIDVRVMGGGSGSPGVLTLWTSLIPTVFVQSTVRVDDDSRHHCVVGREAGGTLKIYVDGVDRTSSVVVSTDSINPSVMYVASAFGTVNGLAGVLQHLAIYDEALSSARIAAHNSAGRTPWTGDTSGERLERILDLVDWPAALRDIDTGDSTLQGASLDSGGALDYAQKIRESEFGALYMTADGKVRFEGRGNLVNQPTVATFGDGPGEVGYVEIVPDYADDLIRNDVTVSRIDGTAQNTQDAASIEEFQIQDYTIDGLLHDDDALSRDAADFFVSEYAQPIQRFTQIRIMPRKDPTVRFPAILARELTDRVTVIRRPQGIGAPIEQISVVEGIIRSWGPKQWETSFDVSPAYAGAFLELDGGDGRLATAGAELTGSFDAVATVFDVTLTGGDLFTTDPGDFPFDITVGDETMTVTAISGAASPQSFTATRPNPATHTAGEAVQVADPVRIYF